MYKKILDRLVQEWKEHGKIVIAVDFDDTIYPWKFKEKEDLLFFTNLIEILNNCRKLGCYISIWSACSPDRYVEILNYCKEKGLEIDSINQNPIDLPYGNHKKMYANIYLDDRAGLIQSLEILQRAYYTILGENNSKAVMAQQF